MYRVRCVFFFFQAEDGIRDSSVTGVQTCALPIFTFIVVALSAYRVSRLNIVAAIRDLDESEQRDAGMLTMLVAPFKVAWAAVNQLRFGHPFVALGRITLVTLRSIRTFRLSLLLRGPLT